MRKRLTYADAVKLLGGTTPGLTALDQALGGALLMATGGGSAAALSLFDAKAEFVRVGRTVLSGLRENVLGVGRFERSERLHAAHSIIAVTAFFESFDRISLPLSMANVDIGREDQLALIGDGRRDESWVDHVLRVALPVPAAECPYADLLRQLKDWYRHLASRFTTYLTGLAVWDELTDTEALHLAAQMRERLPDLAVDGYEELHRRLATDVPDFALWIQRHEFRSTSTELSRIGSGLAALEEMLRQVSSGRLPQQRCAALAAAYRAQLDRPVVGAGMVSAELSIPSLGEIYVNPRFRLRSANVSDPVADEGWWSATPVREDLPGFLAAHLTTLRATEAPLVVLGHPGAGKSALTRVLAARLPAADFLSIRVALRDVPAEAEMGGP